MPEWLHDDAPECDVVVSTRVRLARNLADVPFPSRIRKRGDVELVHNGAVKSLLKSPEFKYARLSDMDELGKRALIERHIISNELARKKGRRTDYEQRREHQRNDHGRRSLQAAKPERGSVDQ